MTHQLVLWLLREFVAYDESKNKNQFIRTMEKGKTMENTYAKNDNNLLDKELQPTIHGFKPVNVISPAVAKFTMPL